ncbi:MAG: hypothetical protein GY752_06380 [bacterium]|nr:hypothetical protein [bacterium]MCP4798968.1 hypothetical protein [bacterium]
MKKAILTLMMLAIATVAFAQIDPDENGIGLYFDEFGYEVCLTTAAPFTPITAYLLATNISEESGISGFECEVTTDGLLTAAAWSLNGVQPLNVFAAPLFAVGLGENELATPVINNVVLLATLTAYVLDPADQVSFGVKNLDAGSFDPPAPGYAAGDNAGLLVPLQVSSGFPYGAAVAQINIDPCGVVANEDVSFGSVKALYR